MHVRVLGDLEVVVDGAVADLGGPKPRALVGLLVAAEGRVVPVEHLVDQVWGDDPPPRVEASLQSYVARVRRALDPARDGRAAVLRTHTGGYSMDLSGVEVDARRFTAALREAQVLAQRDPGGGARLLEDGLALWRGAAYAGLSRPALEAEATRLEELRLGAVEDLWELRLRSGRHRDAVAGLEQLVRTHPLRERMWALLARALYASARQGDALAALRRCREHLLDELGVDPGVELQSLEQAILRQDPDLTPIPAATLVRLRSTAATEATRATGADPSAEGAAGGLVGRDEPLARVSSALADASRGSGRVVLVTGEPGIGKTRFSEAVARAAERRGFRVGRGTWEQEGSPPLWGWRRATAAAFGRTDLLAPPAGPPLDAASESFRLADALVAAAAGGAPVLLLLDDVHWADVDSLRLLRRFAAEVATVPVVLLAAMRPATASSSRAVTELLAGLARLEPVRVELSGLDAPAISAYVAQQAGVDVSGDVADELAERTGGNPFFVTELVRLLAAEGMLGAPEAGRWRRVPRGVLDVVRHRLGQLPGTTAQVLEMGAVVGRAFDVPVLTRALRPRDTSPGTFSGTPADTEAALEPALVSGLVEELGPAHYRFVHALVRDAVYETLPAPRRARLHGQVATALEEHRAGQVLGHAAELVEHYRLAGPAYARSAWVLARKAAEAAASGASHEEALRLFGLARDLQDQDDAVTQEERRDVLVGLARALRRLGRPLEAWPLLADVASGLLRDGDPRAATESLLEITDGAIWGWRERAQVDEQAIALWTALSEALGEGAPALRAKAEAALAVELLQRPDSAEEAVRLVDTAVDRVRRSGGRSDLVEVLQLASLAVSRAHLLHRRLAIADELVELTARADDQPHLALALTKRGTSRGELGRLDDAVSDLTRARLLAERHHLGPVYVIAGWALNVVRLARGELDAAEQHAAELERLMETLSMPGVGMGLAQVAGVRLVQGRLPELEPQLRWAAEHYPGEMRDLHALALVEAGRLEEVRQVLGPWGEQPALLEDYLWVTLTAIRAWTWLRLGDAAAVADLRRQLTPYADVLATGGMSACFLGVVGHTLGRLALAEGDGEGARAHLEAAVAVHEALRAEPWVALSRQALVELSGTGRAVDPEGVPAERPA